MHEQFSVSLNKLNRFVAASVSACDLTGENRIYREGELMSISVKSEKRGYLYLLYCQADNKVAVLFPNKSQRNNNIPAGRDVLVPPPPKG